MSSQFGRALSLAVGALLGGAVSAMAAPIGGAYYETFAGREIAAIDLANPSTGLGVRSGNATNVAVGGDFVYFQDGTRIFKADATLSSVVLFHTNGVAPTDLAINVAGNAYYESFGTQIAAIDLTNPSLGLGILRGNYSNISVSAGKVYFQSGIDIFVADADLSNVSLFHRNGVAPVDFVVDADNNVYYESFGTEIVAIEFANPTHQLGRRTGNISNIMVGDGNVYFQEGTRIWRGDRTLSNVTLYHNNGIAPSDIALMPPPPTIVTDVPEPTSLSLLAFGGVLAGCRRLWRRRPTG